ncbi:MAG TPA: CNP1-like family protein, partial [Burkholderiales bacterium]|nr:CNP1-like family protein [Burkholderiales bacterium]
MRGRVLRLAAAALLLAGVQVGHAQLSDTDEDGNWTEQQLKLPPYPKPADLVQFPVGATGGNRFFVDSTSVNIGADGVVRYTLVIRSPSGAENVSFEGMRCSTGERRVYAFGHRDGTWADARASTWTKLRATDLNNHYSVLYREHFCPDKRIVKTVAIAVQSLRFPPQSQHTAG